MRGKRVLAFTCGLIMACHQMPICPVTVYAEEAETRIITLSDDFASFLSVKDKLYDGTTIADVDFSNVVLVGAEDDETLSLTGNAFFDNADAEEDKTVHITDFELIGDNKDDYVLKLPSEQEEVTVNASIVPAIIYLDPKGTFILGEQLPKEIEYTYRESDIYNDDYVDITAKLSIVDDGHGGYSYEISDSSATGNPNYVLGIDENNVPMPESPLPASISVTSVEKQSASTLEQYDFGIVADGSIRITVSAELMYNIPVTFTLSDGQTFTDNAPVFDRDENIYNAKAEFLIDLNENTTSKDVELTCTVDYSSQTETVDLQMKINDNYDTVSRVIIDQNKPSISNITLKNHGEENERYFDAKGVFIDRESGIKKIRYRWDNDVKSTNWIEYDGFSHNPGDQVEFISTVNWDNSVDTHSKRPNGSHKLELEITDNAGNVYADDQSLITDGADTQAPCVTYIRLDKTTETDWDEIVTTLQCGTFVNQKLILSLKVEDISENEQPSGVKSVVLTDGKYGDEIIIAELNNSGGIYAYKTESELNISSWYVKLTDRNGNYDYYSIRTLLQSDIAKDEVKENDAPEGDKTEPIAVNDMDWSKLKSDNWVFDFSKPIITFNLENAITEGETLYYNDRGGELIISISDEGGLKSVAIKVAYRAFENDDETEKNIKSDVYNTYDSYAKVTKNCSYSINTAELDTGWYTYYVTVSDLAGNPVAATQTKFYVDHASPEGAISVISPLSPNIIDTGDALEHWIREKDEEGNYLPITFRLDAISKGIKLNKISIDVFGYNDQSKHFDFSNRQIVTEGEKNFVTVTISTDPNSTDFLKYNDDNIYKVRASIEAESHNHSQEIYYELHVDTDKPIVEEFKAERKNTAAETILNVLTFGTFANDSIRLTVNAKDGAHDVGLDHVEISYKDANGSYVTDNMIEQNCGVFYYDLDLSTKIFQSDITVIVFDKFNKRSKNMPNIKNTSGDKSTLGNTFVMLENNAPSLVVKLPPADNSERIDGQMWYREHGGESDLEKYIELVVQDKDSGIRQVNMTINGQSIEQFSSEIERNKNALPNIDTTEAQARNDRTKLCSEFHFFYSTDSIARKIPAKDDGSYEIEVEVIDNAGNVTETLFDGNNVPYLDSKAVYYRDTNPPDIVQFIFDRASSDNISQVDQEEFVQELEYGYYFKSGFDVMIVSDDFDPSSELDYAVFRLVPYENGKPKEGIVTAPVPIVNGIARYSIQAGFKGQIYGRIFDKVNNASEECTPRGFVVDKTAPVITVEPLPENVAGKDANGNNIYTETISLKVTVVDMQSGIRSISYSKNSEFDSYGDITCSVDNEAGINKDKGLTDGWQITRTDANLVTEASKVFTFDKDDNDISITFNATDRSGNVSESIKSGRFTIDTTVPKITVINTSALLNDFYYKGSTEFTINIVERNFSPELITCQIENSFTGTSPTISFDSDEDNKSWHTAKVFFPEGDYSLSLSGLDLGGKRAEIAYNGEATGEYFYTSFNVDATKPIIKTNFNDFGEDGDEDIYFNKSQTIEVVVTEHNFYDKDMEIIVLSKSSGTTHVIDDKEWTDIGYRSNWVNEGDKHTLKISFVEDGVYRIFMAPKDRAGNRGEFLNDSPDHTAIFEIDTTAPIYSARNGQSTAEKGFVTTPFCDVYDEKRRNENPPTVEFDDLNFDRIEVDTVIYTPMYENGKELGEIFMSPISAELSKSVCDKKFELPNFNRDGAYAFTFVAVDKAGNRSEPVNNTYFRMVDTDVLAYIYNSQIGDTNSDDRKKQPSGYYSLMNTDGKAISKKATDFDDLDILVIKPTADRQAGTLLLREDEKQYSPYQYNGFTIKDEKISETASLIKMHLPGEYFSETFRDDGLNARMYLSVSIRDDVYLDLASIHIDNEAPTASLPRDFKNWHNYFFESEHNVALTNINEVLNDGLSKVYECQRNGERVEIPHKYDPQNGTFSFVLGKGVHHIDITLVDEAGNEWDVDRVKYIRVGNFRLYFGVGIVLVIGATSAFLIVKKKKKHAEKK